MSTQKEREGELLNLNKAVMEMEAEEGRGHAMLSSDRGTGGFLDGWQHLWAGLVVVVRRELRLTQGHE